MLTTIPSELILTISEHLDPLDIIRLRATCKELQTLLTLRQYLCNSEHMTFFKSHTHVYFLYDTNDIVQYIIKDLEVHDNVFAYSKQYRMLTEFPEYILTFVINTNVILFHITHEQCLTEQFEFRMLECNIVHGHQPKMILHTKQMKIPLLLLFLGIQVLMKLRSISFDSYEKNCEYSMLPSWYEKALFSNNYSGILFSDLITSSVFVTRV